MEKKREASIRIVEGRFCSTGVPSRGGCAASLKRRKLLGGNWVLNLAKKERLEYFLL